MPRYNDADALLETEPEVCADYGEEYGAEFGYSRDQIANAPTISPDEVRGVGKWIPLDYSDEAYGNMYKCSKCGCSEIGEPNYCPNCGARMGGVQDALY